MNAIEIQKKISKLEDLRGEIISNLFIYQSRAKGNSESFYFDEIKNAANGLIVIQDEISELRKQCNSRQLYIEKKIKELRDEIYTKTSILRDSAHPVEYKKIVFKRILGVRTFIMSKPFERLVIKKYKERLTTFIELDGLLE